MARDKGTGSLQKEKNGYYTARCSIRGIRVSRATRTKNKDIALRLLDRMCAPNGRNTYQIPLCDVWSLYDRSLTRRELAAITLNVKKNVWNQFAEWVNDNYPGVVCLELITPEIAAQFLRTKRSSVSATTYNNILCSLREVYRVVAKDAKIDNDPWEGLKLLSDDSHSRREFTVPELNRILNAAEQEGPCWKLLFIVGMYTGLRLGDCCLLEWAHVNFDKNVIQVIPRKTRRHAHGVPVTIPLHAELLKHIKEMEGVDEKYVNPECANYYNGDKAWRINHHLTHIFKVAGITTSVKIEGRKTPTPDATFHSLRHTFVSFSVNAGVPLPVVQSIVGHTSSMMTRHYYHENEEQLQRAVMSVPSIADLASGATASKPVQEQPVQVRPLSERLNEVKKLLDEGLVTKEEYDKARASILASA